MFPSPCGVIGVKGTQENINLGIGAASTQVSVPLRGNRRESPVTLQLSMPSVRGVSVPLRGNRRERRKQSYTLTLFEVNSFRPLAG